MTTENNQSKQSAAAFVQSLVSDEARRKKLLSFFASSIEKAHQANPSSWCLTLRKARGLIRLNVGRAMVLDLSKDFANISILGDESASSKTERVPSRVRSEKTTGHFSSIPGAFWQRVTHDELIANWEKWQAAHLKLLEAAASAVSQTPYYRAHSPELLGYIADVTGRSLPSPSFPDERLTSRQIDTLVESLRKTFQDWENFQNPDFLKAEITYKRGASELARQLLSREALEDLLGNSDHAEIIERIRKVGQKTNLLFRNQPLYGDLNIIHEEVLKDTASFCREFHRLLHSDAPSPDRLAAYVDWADNEGLPNKWTFATYFLFLTNPSGDIFVKPTVTTAFCKKLGIKEKFAGKPSADQYARLLQVAEELLDRFSDRGARDMIDIQSVLWVAGKERTLLPTTDQFWKIAPGEQAWQWEECLEGGFIAIGWDELGDLSGLSRPDFDKRVAGLVAQKDDWTKKGVDQAWKFAHIKEGDRVIANRGKSEVLGTGTVCGPYYFVPGVKYGHRLPVAWEDTELRKVNEGGWTRTLVKLDRAKYEEIMGLTGTTQDQAFTKKSFALLEGLHETPTRKYYSQHQEDFKEHVEEPIRSLLAAVGALLSPAITSVLETESRLYSRIAKNDWGRGGAWDFYWGAFYPKGGKRIADAQLFLWVNRNFLDFGFFIGEHGSESRKKFLRNCSEYRAELSVLLRDSLSDPRFVFGNRAEDLYIDSRADEKLASLPKWEEWLRDPAKAGVRIGAPLSAQECLAASRDDLVELIKTSFESLFPLFLLATSDDPLPEIERYLDGEGPGPGPINPTYLLATCAEETGFALGLLERWARAIDRKKQAVLYGPPGTGKTYIAEKLAQHLIGGGAGFSELVQFHPAYAYEDFIQGLRPKANEDGGLSYEVERGRFLDFCRRAARLEDTCVLIIDEINRANLARVFGELMYLLEYRGSSVPLAGGGSLKIPPNVRILGTMNTADRSIALVDHALRRRFAFLALQPEPQILERYHEREKTNFEASKLSALLSELNSSIGDPNYAVGITFFLRRDLDIQMEDIWRMEIEPYLEEYFFDQSSKVETYRWANVAKKLGL